MSRRGPAQTRSSAGQSEHANSLGVGRNSPARMRAIASESSASSRAVSALVNVAETTSSGRSRNWYDDLDLGRAVAQARERVDEPLEAVLGLDDLVRIGAVEDVRLVVDDERALARPPEHVEPAVQEDAVVLERERALRPGAVERRQPPRERRRAVRVDERRDALELVVARDRIPGAHGRLELRARRRDGRVERDRLEQAVHRVADLVAGEAARAAVSSSSASPSRRGATGGSPSTRSAK